LKYRNRPETAKIMQKSAHSRHGGLAFTMAILTMAAPYAIRTMR
jgi:hypothetical protein